MWLVWLPVHPWVTRVRGVTPGKVSRMTETVLGVAALVAIGVGAVAATSVFGRRGRNTDKRAVLAALDGQTITLTVARGQNIAERRGRLEVGDAERSIVFVDDDPDVQRRPLGLNNPREGELIWLGEILAAYDSEGRLVGGPW
jgi:hypothetical protein